VGWWEELRAVFGVERSPGFFASLRMTHRLLRGFLAGAEAPLFCSRSAARLKPCPDTRDALSGRRTAGSSACCTLVGMTKGGMVGGTPGGVWRGEIAGILRPKSGPQNDASRVVGGGDAGECGSVRSLCLVGMTGWVRGEDDPTQTNPGLEWGTRILPSFCKSGHPVREVSAGAEAMP